MHRFNHWIDGKDSPAAPGSRVFEKFSPEDGSLAALVPEAGPAEVDAAVQSARRALRAGWSRTSAGERGVQLRRIAAGIRERFDEFVAAECADTGKPASLARHLDVPRASANFEAFADLHNNLPTDAFEMPTRDGGTAISLGQRIPRGVVGVISPWNLPLLLMTWKVAPALACGNAVVVKPSELSPTSANLLGEVIAAAGVPAGVYNVVHGFGAASTGQLLAEHPDVNAITVTGSTQTG